MGPVTCFYVCVITGALAFIGSTVLSCYYYNNRGYALMMGVNPGREFRLLKVVAISLLTIFALCCFWFATMMLGTPEPVTWLSVNVLSKGSEFTLLGAIVGAWIWFVMSTE